MRVSNSISIIICGVAAYFALHWGSDAVMIFVSPMHGLDNESFSRSVRGFAQLFGASSEGMLLLAALFGAMKLGTAAIFALYLARRLVFSGDENVDHDLLETALVLVVTTVALLALPFIFVDSGMILNQFRVPLWLVGLAATLTLIERAVKDEADDPSRVKTIERERAVRFAHASLMLGRRGVGALRWNRLRAEANIDRAA